MIRKNFIQTVFPAGIYFTMDSRGCIMKKQRKGGATFTLAYLGCAFGDPNYHDCEYDDWWCSQI